tara:strand:- start:1200 stop:2300 length:1101 start_codon:yes stop_codon:yes gene_type:complete
MINFITVFLLLNNMQRTSLLMAVMFAMLCFSNCYSVSAEESEDDDCWVIVKETYEWITDDEEMANMHTVESNLTYDSQCRLVERTDTSYDSQYHDFISYNEDSTISNTSRYWYDSDGDIIYLWQEGFGYENGILVSSNWIEFSNDNGNLSINQEYTTSYDYDGEGREILANSTTGESSTTVDKNYDENGNLVYVNTSINGQLRTSIEYQYNSENRVISETSTSIYGSSQTSRTTNYSYDDSWKLVSKEQHDGSNNWTIYWNYSYDDKGNQIVEEYNRVGNSPWTTITTSIWGYGTEQTGSQTDLDVSDSEDESSSNTWWSLSLIILILLIIFFLASRSKVGMIGTLIDKIIEEKFEEKFEEKAEEE